MNLQNVWSSLMEWSIFGPLADEVLALATGALLVVVASLIAAQVWQDRLHPSRTGKDITIAR